MKFNDGQWRIRSGINIYHPVELRDIVHNEKCVVVYATCLPIRDRVDTVHCPLLEIRITSPISGVLGIRITHFKGGRLDDPSFVEKPEDVALDFQETENEIRITGGSLSLRFRREGWGMRFYEDDRALTGSGPGDAGYVVVDRKGTFVKETLDLGVGEYVYGMGERFTAFVKNGQAVETWNEDGGTSSELAYKNIPFYLTNKGYGVLVNHSENVAFEVASEKVSGVQFSVAGEYLEYYLIGGGTPKKVLENYTALTGRPALPPPWSFGLWLTTSFTTDYDEETVNHFVDGMAQRDLPLSVFHFDCFWMKEFHWCNLEWDSRVFPDPEGMIRRLKAKGLKICAWINPYIAQRSKLFAEGKAKSYLLKKANGDVWQWDHWQAGMAFIDFTNPAACQWFTSHLRALLDMGVDCFKTDFGERIPIDVVYFDGSDPMKMHNYYTYLYNKTVFELLEAYFGKGRAALFARSATVGGQCFPIHWGGDSWATYPSMAESLRGGLSLALSGFCYWSHDIGGFEQTATADLYKRWVAFGLLSSHSRLHGSTSYRVPWLFDEEAVDVVRFFTKQKYRLMPYIWSMACQAVNKGIPVMRAMMLEFPTDPAVSYLDRQYMLGDSLLVAPIFSEDGIVDYYLPEGVWTNLLSGGQQTGGRWRRVKHDYFSLPLMVRANTLLPVGHEDCRPDYDYADDVTLHLFQLEDGGIAETTVYNMEGEPDLTVKLQRTSETIRVESEGQGKPWTMLLRDIAEVERVEGGRMVAEADGVRLIPEGYIGIIIITLKSGR